MICAGLSFSRTWPGADFEITTDSGSECVEPRRLAIYALFLNFAASSDPPVASPAL
jgi:hypothetical protein